MADSRRRVGYTARPMADFSTLPEHLQKPHLRPFQPLGVEQNGQKLVVLRDPAMLKEQSMMVQPQALQVLQHFNGDRTMAEVVAALQIKDDAHVNALIGLVTKLDEMGLVWGPTLEALEKELKEKLMAAGAFPAVASASLGKDPEAAKEQIQKWLDETEDPEVEGTPVAIVAPHLDYARGWPNFAAAYRCLDGIERPDRVVILGTNHFGIGDGVVLTELGFDTPFGRVPADSRVIGLLREKLGDRLLVDQLDHHGEHSIQLHLPWLQHRFGDVPIVAALIPDPMTPMIAEDDARVGGEQFIDAMIEALDEVGGRTLVVSSADLSHVGPQFGEPRPVDDQRRHDVERQDRDLMGKFISGDPAEFLSAVQWCKNPTRWCSVGNMYATLRIAKPTSIELIDYRQASDEQGMMMVSSAAMALLRD